MLVYAGIDEAGYGPMFGPLCVGASVLVLETHDPSEGEPDLWSILNHIICKKRRDARHRIAINDSKKLKSGSTPRGLLHLERGVLAFLAAMEIPQLVQNDEELYRILGSKPSTATWSNNATPLPVAVDSQELRIDATLMRREFAHAHVRCDMLACTTIDAATYNKRTAIESKASLNFSTAMQLVNSIVQRWPDEHPRIMIDRHGGRIRYRDNLQHCWPDGKIQILTEDQSMSRYRLQLKSSTVTITFATKSDAKYLPVALASMVAKYTRELHMIRLNRFFGDLIPELKPTAGYVRDGRRFLKEIEPLLEKKGLNRDLLVRTS